ncbi:MAG TPA: hypothetical protein VIG47_03510, partial [Gemmatimonadaceae bacterium]
MTSRDSVAREVPLGIPEPSAGKSCLRIVHVSFFRDPYNRDGDALLRDWPTLRDVAVAVNRSGLHVAVVQAAARDETLT